MPFLSRDGSGKKNKSSTGGRTPFKVVEYKITTKEVPPLCISCYCIRAKETCRQKGGVQFIDVVAVGSLTSINGLSCRTTTISGPCILDPPPLTLSVCDPSCRKPTGTCKTSPDASSCIAFSQSETPQCGSSCENVSEGTAVRCDEATLAISPRPKVSCGARFAEVLRANRKFNDTETPVIESSMTDEPLSRMPRRGMKVRKITSTLTETTAGIVTATYVAKQACLPPDLLASPAC